MKSPVDAKFEKDSARCIFCQFFAEARDKSVDDHLNHCAAESYEWDETACEGDFVSLFQTIHFVSFDTHRPPRYGLVSAYIKPITLSINQSSALKLASLVLPSFNFSLLQALPSYPSAA